MSKERADISNRMHTEKCYLLQRYVLFKWKEHVIEQHKEKEAISRAQNLYFHWLKKKVFFILFLIT